MMSPNQIPENRGPSHPANFRGCDFGLACGEEVEDNVVSVFRTGPILKLIRIMEQCNIDRQTPLQVIHVIGNLMRIWSVYSMYRYLSQTGASVLLFIFSCLVPSSILCLLLQKPWKGRPLTNTQVVPSVINGGITALYFILWGMGLKSCGPLRAILAEYSGAVLGVLSAVLYGRRGNLWKKVGGLFAMLASFYFLSQGWAMATKSPFYILSKLTLTVNSLMLLEESEVESEEIGVKDMLIPVFAGVLSAIRRVVARRLSLKNQLKRRLHAITIASATCFLFPVAMWDMIIGSTSVELPFSAWAFSSFVLFGIILIFYVDSIAEERLHMVFSSPRHLLVAGGCVIVMEISYKMDFSLPGFLLCAAILGFAAYVSETLPILAKNNFLMSNICISYFLILMVGRVMAHEIIHMVSRVTLICLPFATLIVELDDGHRIHEATSLDRTRKDSLQSSDISNGVYEDRIQMSALPT
ncbi:hypothetical protein Sango_1832300 [Sesamum angolense]|uniref:Zinc transporter 5 n=1 Tax=Sesamum angolense TaxID=2727404 RepID=A0AAE1WHU3_9LAMI|nr:hypothetical protein Sango_1832300 [Sesamum angolense]